MSYLVTKYAMLAANFGSFCILLDTGCNAPVASRKEFLNEIYDNDANNNSANTLGGAYSAPYQATSISFGDISFDPALPFTILSYYFTELNGYIVPIDALNFKAGFPTGDGNYMEIKFRFIDGMLMGDGAKLATCMSQKKAYFTRNPSMGRLNEGKSSRRQKADRAGGAEGRRIRRQKEQTAEA